MQSATYLIHGLRVRSELPLPEALAPAGEGVDLDVRRGGEKEIGFAPPPGDVILEQPFGDFGLAIAERDGDLALRFFGLCEFRVIGAGGAVEVRRQSDVGEDVAAALLVAGVLPCLLVRRGCRLLHASAVRYEGRTIALAGGTGAGKSMTAAQLCADGAELITDDVLRVEDRPDGQGQWCHRGTARILLHSGDAVLAERFPAERRRPCWDGRIAVAAPAVAEPVLALDETRRLSSDSGLESWQLLARQNQG
jgi:hypothetical protein